MPQVQFCVELLDPDDACDEPDDTGLEAALDTLCELCELLELLDRLELLSLELLPLELLVSPRGSIGRLSNPKFGGIDTARVWQTYFLRFPRPTTDTSQRT